MREQEMGNMHTLGKNNQIIQIAVIGMAMTSFFTTAQGMSKYIFGAGLLSYATSGAIQIILFAMSMGLPQYLHAIFEKQWLALWKVVVSGLIVILTMVSMFCSSWFSYIYIAEVVHFESWDTESELIVQQTYREQLYEAKDYAHAYRVYLESSLGEKIVELQMLTENISKKEDLKELNTDWEEERLRYESMNSLVQSYMLIVVEAMQKVMEEEAPSQSLLDQAARVIEETQTNINERRENVEKELEEIENQINQYDTRIAELTRRINSATSETDITGLNNSLNNTVQALEDATETQNSKRDEHEQLKEALGQLDLYRSQLGLNNSTSAISIRSELLNMQTEFFSENSNEEKLLETARSIFENLRKASTGQSENNDLNYTTLLVQMNQLILNLKDYIDIKETESKLDDYISGVSLTDKAELSKGLESAKDWKSNWNGKLEALKSTIAAMPVYVEQQSELVENSVLTDSQRGMLQNYNRTEASKLLDDMIRLYVTDHNALYQGIIYLFSPYNALAIFSLILAFFFDLSGFILGFVKLGDYENVHNNTLEQEEDNVSWSILPTLNKYRILTGDYERRDNVYLYQVFADGILQKWEVENDDCYKQGIYIQNATVENKGVLVESDREIHFSGQTDGPQDGVYSNVGIRFHAGSLLRVKADEEKFVANLDEFVPVYNYIISKGECQTIPASDLSNGIENIEKVVCALNDMGSRIVAIYMISK